MSSEESGEELPVKKQKTKFTPRTGLTIQVTTPVLETPIKRIASVSIPPNVNNDKANLKRKLIDDIKNLQGEIVNVNNVNSENVNSENIKKYITIKIFLLYYYIVVKLISLSLIPNKR